MLKRIGGIAHNGPVVIGITTILGGSTTFGYIAHTKSPNR